MQWLSFAFEVFCVVLFGLALIATRHYRVVDSEFPWFFCGLGFLLSAYVTIRDLQKVRKGQTRDTGAVASEFNSAEANLTRANMIGMAVFVLTIVAIFVGVALVGLPITFLVFIVIYPRLHGHVRWRTILIAIPVTLTIIIYLDSAMGISWPTGILSNWVNLPWFLQ